MPSVSREGSRDRELVRHQHSFSTDSASSRSPIPMWDSSDPERAPPPLPMNPGSPNVATTRPNTSATIAAAAQALQEKARESAHTSAYTTNPMPQKSPERSLIKGVQHKRMQSLQTGHVRDLRSYLDGNRSPERSPERAIPGLTTPIYMKDIDKDDIFSCSPEKSSGRHGTPTPSGRDFLKDTPSLRPSSRMTHKAILGENTPPSATMLALQTMPVRDFDPPLADITNSARTPQTQSIDALSSQLSGLTSIATNLQREMAQLSRRSKDNATDLISLKEATNSRDEDIRKSLRDLVNTVSNSASQPNLLGSGSAGMPRSSSTFGATIFDGKPPHASPPSATKSFTLPRIPSPSSFMIDERVDSPSPYSIEGAASVAMLEKIIREMVTKEGQERLLTNLSQLLDKQSGETAKKVTELTEFIKSSSENRMGSAGSFAQSGPLSKPGAFGSDSQKPFSHSKSAETMSSEVMEMLNKIMKSVIGSGSTSHEVKGLVRELRGEVLGMGRDIARQLDEAGLVRGNHLSIEDGKTKEDVGRIVREGLVELKLHMDEVIRENRRQSGSSMISRASVDSKEIYDVVKHALAERGLDRGYPGDETNLGMDKKSILDAVKEACESFKPEIELQQFGLEREEILQTIGEGLEHYRSANATNGISKEEVMEAVSEALQHFPPPAPVNPTAEIREEVLFAVRECLDDLKPLLHQPAGDQLTRETVLDALKEGLANHGSDAPREIKIRRDDLFDAVKAGLEESGSSFGGYGEQVMNRLQELVNDMHSEFKAYSSASGRDTEQVLDAMKDGLETLRSDIETYVDRSQDVTGKDEIVDTIRSSLEQLRSDVEGYVATGAGGDAAFSKAELFDYIKSEFEHLHESFVGGLVPSSKDKDDILEVLHEEFESLKAQVGARELGGDSSEEMQEAFKVELDQLRVTILDGSSTNKDDVLDAIQNGLDSLHSRLDERGAEGNNSGEVLTVMKEEFEHLRETLATILVKSNPSTDKEDIVDAVRECVDGLKVTLTSDENASAKEALATIQGELEHLRETLSSTLVRSGSIADKEEILEALRLGLADIHDKQPQNAVDAELLEAIRGEFEQIRQSIGVRGTTRADTEEVLDAIRLGLDDLRSHLEKKIDSPERHQSSKNEILDAINDGLESLRSDVVKMADKPVDMTVSYEILDTLKDGLADLRSDIDKLKSRSDKSDSEELIEPTGNEVVLAEGPDASFTRDIPRDMPLTETQPDTLRRNDLENLEVMLSQIQTKVEALNVNIQIPPTVVDPPSEPPTSTVTKDDLLIIEDMLKDLQVNVANITIQERENDPNVATKEDTDAIETLLRNTKAQIDELNLPAPSTLSQEQIDAIEALVRTTNETLEGLGARLEEKSASKEDIAVVEVLVGDMKTALDELKVLIPVEDEATKISKIDLDILGVLCTEIKQKLETPDPETTIAKADIEQIIGLIHDFRESHDKMKDSYEADIAVTAKAFDDRKKEAEDTQEGIFRLRAFVDEVKDELKTKIEDGTLETTAVLDAVKRLDDTIDATSSVNSDIKELMELVSREFERAHGTFEGLRTEQDEKSTRLFEKHDEIKATLIGELSQKLEEKFDAIMMKYDDALLAADAQARAIEEKSASHEELLSSTKAMAEDLKLTIDTLGSSIAGLGTSFTETTEKISEDSQGVFSRLDDTLAKMDVNHGESKVEHQLTRDEIVKVLDAVGAVHGDITEAHPKIMVTLREVLALVNQHYEHAQKEQETVREQARITAEESKARVEEIKKSFSALPALLPPPPPAVEAPPPIDDTKIHEKLDKLMDQSRESVKMVTSLERLDQIHKQVMATAAEVSNFVTSQTQLITEGHESKEREAEEIALLVERRTAQKEQLEAEVRGLNDEKESLRAAIESMKVEREALYTQKSRLAADVSSLHTALDIRREELQIMDAKADALERRIMEGIMNQSRALLLNKAAKGVPKPSIPFQRASSNASHSTIGPLPGQDAATKGLNIALNNRPQPRRNNAQQSNPANRRILSLSQITHNVPTGGHSSLSGSPKGAVSNIKRSHSVKTNHLPKPTWGTVRRSVSDAKRGKSDHDKENMTLGEESEDDNSQAGTERRHSYAPTTSSFISELSEGITPSVDGRRSYGVTDSDLTYGTSNYITGTDIDRRTSYGSTIRSNLENTIDEESEGEDSGAEHEEDVHSEHQGAEGDTTMIPLTAETGKMVFAAPSDSALGSDLPTAIVGNESEADYFRRQAEEGSVVSRG
ncbi:hypothetical protein M501DRAFT_941649 [Patellaria atrata CBS 101060]|uniref:Uncharacterized protein n=1 Tax=Patellaria atrata CBS 101060 TaxID=1346257 RepID=A0A9P4S3X9_9PEZI|nr:hypothetical protein M501DRAFT_941649 [Patellaria atrata CBS 101060]